MAMTMLSVDPQEYIPEDMTEPKFGSLILQNFNEFREEGLFCDFRLKVGYETFHVHRMVLAGCSDYFRALFSHGMQDSNTSSMQLDDITLDGVRPLIDFAYTGHLSLSLANVSEILAAATFLQVTLAIKLCSQFLKSHMTFDNADRLVLLGCNHGLTELKQFHTDMILDNFFEFAATQRFLELDAKTLAGYLEQDALKTSTEGRLLKQALRWYEYDPGRREEDIYEVMEKIRFTLDGWPTIEHAMDVEPFVSNKKCSELIDWCHNFMRHASHKHLVKSHRTRVRFHRRTLVQVGGVRMQHAFFIDEVDGEISIDPDHGEKSGCGKNHYYHRGLAAWFPVGVVGTMESRSHCPMVEVNDFGVLVGGYTYTQDFEKTHQHATSDVTLFTPGGFAMWDLKPMLQERAHHAVVHTQNYILYAIGGKDDEGPLKTVEMFNMEKEKWQYVRPLRKPLYDHAGCNFGQTVYICGGVESGVVIDKLMSYEPKTDVWEELVPMLACRSNHGMVTLGSQLLVCGGRTSLDTPRCLASVEAYNLELRQWTHITPMRQDCCDLTAVVLENKLLVVGGENSVGDLLDSIQAYDPKTRTWGTFAKLPFAAKNIGTCALTIKETPDGMEETDSLTEAYSAKFDNEESYLYESDASNDYEDYMGAGWHV